MATSRYECSLVTGNKISLNNVHPEISIDDTGVFISLNTLSITKSGSNLSINAECVAFYSNGNTGGSIGVNNISNCGISTSQSTTGSICTGYANPNSSFFTLTTSNAGTLLNQGTFCIYAQCQLSNGYNDYAYLIISFNTSQLLKPVFFRSLSNGESTALSSPGIMGTATGFGKEIKSVRITFSGASSYYNITSGSSYVNTSSTINPSYVSNIQVKNVNNGSSNQTLTINYYGYNETENTLVSNATLVGQVSRDITLLPPSSLIISLNNTTFNYDKRTELEVMIHSTAGSPGTKVEFVILNTNDAVIYYHPTNSNNVDVTNTIQTLSSSSMDLQVVDLNNNYRLHNFYLKNTSLSNKTITLGITFYNNSNTITGSTTISITLVGKKLVLTSTKKDYFKYVPKQLGHQFQRPLTHIEPGYDASTTASGTQELHGNYMYPIGFDSSNQNYSIIYATDEQDTQEVTYYFEPNLGVWEHTSHIIVRLRAIREAQIDDSSNETNVAHIDIINEGNIIQSFDIINTTGENPEFHEITINGDYGYAGSLDIYDVQIKFTVGYYGGCICGYDVIYVSSSEFETINEAKGIFTYSNINSSGSQPVQVWPPIYDISLNGLSLNPLYNNYTVRYLATTYQTSGAIASSTYNYLSSPINYSAESPNTSISGNIYATSGNTALVFYRNTNFSSLDASYLGAYITCYVNGKSESTTKDSTHYCRVRLYSWHDDGLIGDTTYIQNTSPNKYTIANRVWITRADWNNYYGLQSGGLYVELGVANFGGLLRGITINVEYVKSNGNLITFPVSVNRYEGPAIVDNSAYTYLRTGALNLTRGTGNFPTSTLNSTVNFSTSTYSNLSFGDNTSTHTLYSNNDSYNLFLTPAPSGVNRIPNNNYNYTSSSSTLSPSTFGYYFCGYFALPNTYTWGGSSNHTTESGNRNYTGKNLVDWNSSTYISRYKFTNFNGLKGWKTVREPVEWTASWSSSSQVNSQSVTVVFNSNPWAGSNYNPKYLYLTNKGSINYLWSKDYSGSGTLSNNWNEMHGQYGLGGTVTMSNDGSPGTYGIQSFVTITSTSNGITVSVSLDDSILQRIVTNTSGSTLQIKTQVANTGNTNTHYLNNKTYYDSSLSKIRNSSHTSINVYLIYTGNYGLQNWASVTMGHKYLGTIYWVPSKWKYTVQYID